MNEPATPAAVGSSEQLGPVAEVRDGLLRLHIPSDDYSLPPRFLQGTHMLYEIASKAALDVLGERTRQIEAEGWTPEHDDEHSTGGMAFAAAAYAAHAHGGPSMSGALWRWTGWAARPGSGARAG